MNIFDLASNKEKNITGSAKKKSTKTKSISYIHYSKINPCGFNDVVYKESPRFNEESIAQLAETIKLSGEIKEPLIVKKTDIGEYELIAGHRRRLAAINLVEIQNMEEFSMLPCIIDNSTDNMSKFNLIITNTTQGERTDADKAREVSALSKLIESMVKDGEIVPVKARELRAFLAEQLNLSETKVAQFQNIERNLIPHAKEAFQSGEMGVSVANELAGLNKDEQEAVIEDHMTSGNEVKLKDVKKVKEAKKDTNKKPDDVQKPDYLQCGKYKYAGTCKGCIYENDCTYYDRSQMPVPGQMNITDYDGVLNNIDREVSDSTLSEDIQLKNITGVYKYLLSSDERKAAVKGDAKILANMIKNHGKSYSGRWCTDCHIDCSPKGIIFDKDENNRLTFMAVAHLVIDYIKSGKIVPVNETDTPKQSCDGKCFYCDNEDCNGYQEPRTRCTYDNTKPCNMRNAHDVAIGMGVNCTNDCCNRCDIDNCGAKCNNSKHIVPEVEVKQTEIIDDEKTIDNLDLSPSVYNALIKAGLKELSKITQMTERELLQVEKIDGWAVKKIIGALGKNQLSLAEDPDEDPEYYTINDVKNKLDRITTDLNVLRKENVTSPVRQSHAIQAAALELLLANMESAV